MKVQVCINLFVTTLGKHRRTYSLNTDLHSRSRNRKQKRNETIYREGHGARSGRSWKEKEAKKKRIIRSEAKEVKGELGRNLVSVEEMI